MTNLVRLLLRFYYCVSVLWSLCVFFERHSAYTYISRGLQLKQRVRDRQGRRWSVPSLCGYSSVGVDAANADTRLTECPRYKALPQRQCLAQSGTNISCPSAHPVPRALMRPRAFLQHYGRGRAQDLSALNAVTYLGTFSSSHNHRTSSTARSRNLRTSWQCGEYHAPLLSLTNF